MAMNLGYKSRILVLGRKEEIGFTNTEYTNMFDANGVCGLTAGISEENYLDLGIVTDEQESFSSGGIPLSIPTLGAGSRINWNIGGKIIRITLSGIIPDGVYVGSNLTTPTSTSTYLYNLTNGKSNASVFRYKINKFFAYASLFNTNSEGVNTYLMPNSVQYRRTYMFEMYSNSENTELASWTVTTYSFSFINGTRNVQYTLSMDLSNNTTGAALYNSILNNSTTGIRPRDIGDTK